MQPHTPALRPPSRPPASRATHARQRGTTLLEALVSLLVLTLGMLSVGRVQTQLRLNSELSRQRSEAVRLAQLDLEQLRAFTQLAASAGGGRSFADITNRHRTVEAGEGAASPTRYEVERSVTALATPLAKATTVTVSWSDRTGSSHRVVLDSVIAGLDPAHAGALSLLAFNPSPVTALGRSALIPVPAANLGNGSSAFKPLGLGTTALVMNNTTGLVTGRCSVADAARRSQDLRQADLLDCQAVQGHLISGLVRFSAAVPATAAPAADLPLALSMTAVTTLGAASAPWCSSEDQKIVRIDSAAGPRSEAVPAAATPAWRGVSGWLETGERHVAYHCVVSPAAAPANTWSGRVDVQPQGWTIGTNPDQWRVCRYVTDLDGSGLIDANAEHPARYANLSSALGGQNFLVVRGPQNCPYTATATPGGSTAPGVITAAHQP